MGANVYLKREDLTRVRSFKLRGAYNAMAQLDAAERAAGVVTASAGNHAQGVAYACRVMGIQGRIYVPPALPSRSATGSVFTAATASNSSVSATPSTRARAPETA
ncbi:threonine dehydratase, partial [Rhodococcus sp. IITR03]